MRILTLIGLILLASLIGGVYGALYDQLTYSISPEFFTKFRFQLFSPDPATNKRLVVAWIGFLNTWKTGAIIGGGLALTGMINLDYKRMFKFSIYAFLIALTIAFVTGIIGWSVSPLASQADPGPELNILDKDAFKTVVNMNNFSYAGGVIGMFVGALYQLYGHRKYRMQQSLLNNELR
jgi:hypothetical protein